MSAGSARARLSCAYMSLFCNAHICVTPCLTVTGTPSGRNLKSLDDPHVRYLKTERTALAASRLRQTHTVSEACRTNSQI
jgi:hypothetical protein